MNHALGHDYRSCLIKLLSVQDASFCSVREFYKMTGKRKRVVLSVKDKLEILEKLKKGESGASLAKKHGVGEATISDLKKNSDEIIKFAAALDSEDGSKERKTMKTAENGNLDSAVYTWFLQKRSLGEPISGPLLREKALILNEKLNGDPEFKASRGWLHRFNSRHGIRELEIHGEKLSADPLAANGFKVSFKDLIDTSGYDRDNVYNADETGLNWKSLPSRSLASRQETAAPGFKVSKLRITAMTCANVSGTHRLPMLLIGKSKKPRCFKNVKNLPIIYKNQKNAWMDCSVFLHWYDNTFIPEVKKQQKLSGKTGKVLLLIDNAPSHPEKEELEREKGKFKAIFLPPNVTSILQPMDQGVIETFKRLYRKQLLRRLLLTDEENAKGVVIFFKKLDLKDCCYMVADAWASVESSTLQKSWRKLLPEEILVEEVGNNVESTESAESLASIAREIPGFSECDAENVNEWLRSDEGDPGYQILSEDEIVSEILHSPAMSDEEEEENTENENGVLPSGPTHAEAVNAFETAMKWLENQEECDAMQLLQFKRFRDLAAKKRNGGLKQKSMVHFFPSI